MIRNSPVDLRDIASMATKMKVMLNGTKRRREGNQIFEIRTQLNVIIRALISLLHKEDIIKTKADIEVFLRLQENFGRLLNVLEQKEDLIASRPIDNYSGTRRIEMSKETLSYITELESIFIGDIYLPIKRALERNPKDGREFLYNIYEVLSLNVGIFGSEGRLKGKTTSKSIESPPINAKALLSDEGQKSLNKSFDEKFKGFQDLEIANKVFG